MSVSSASGSTSSANAGTSTWFAMSSPLSLLWHVRPAQLLRRRGHRRGAGLVADRPLLPARDQPAVVALDERVLVAPDYLVEEVLADPDDVCPSSRRDS